jgi:arylsulfatase A-like enzyme
MKNALMVFVGLLILVSLYGRSAGAEHPNVLFIAVDDLNDWVGCLEGHPQAHTPHIDRLAARGVLFTNAHCAAPACNPSRAAIFSGRMPNRTGVWSNQSPKLSKLQPDDKQLPTAFADSGYVTLGTGKLSGDRRTTYAETLATEQRWSPFSREAVVYTDEELPSKGTEDPRHVLQDSLGRTVVLPRNRMPSDRAPNKDSGESFDWSPFDLPDSDFGDTRITTWAMDQLKKDFGRPFFLGVGYYRPHIPLFAPKRFFKRFEHEPGKLPAIRPDDLDDLNETAKRWALEPVTAGSHATVVKYGQWQAAVEAYLACVAYVDHEIGRLLDALDDSPAGDDTVIVLWSDHGWHLGEKQHWGKWTGWERSTRVPLIIVPAKKLDGQFAAAGSRCDQPVNLVDLYPTLVELCGLEAPPQELDGQSLVPLLREPELETHRAVVTMFDPGNTSLRTSSRRYIRYADGSEELYDMIADPNEWDNLASQRKHSQEMVLLRRRLKPLLGSHRKPND